jgi:hypothetical protein
MATETPQGRNEGTLTIKKEGNTYSGTISGGRLASPVDLEDVSLDGNALSFKYTVNFGGQSMTVTVETTVEGDTFTGTASVGQFGSFPVEGKKNPK